MSLCLHKTLLQNEPPPHTTHFQQSSLTYNLASLKIHWDALRCAWSACTLYVTYASVLYARFKIISRKSFSNVSYVVPRKSWASPKSSSKHVFFHATKFFVCGRGIPRRALRCSLRAWRLGASKWVSLVPLWCMIDDDVRDGYDFWNK